MGLFGRKKNKNIELKQDISGYLVFPYPLKHNIVYLNRKVIVPETCVLGVAQRGKVLDVLPSGEHVMSPVIIPNSAKRQKLYKLDKDGRAPEGFYGYLYYINLAPVENFTFSTYKKLRYNNEVDGKFWAKLEFALKIQIVDLDKLMKSLLNELAILKASEAEKIVGEWFGEVITDFLASQKFRKVQFDKTRINDMLELVAVKLHDVSQNVGLKLLGVKVLEVELPKVKRTNKNPLLNISVDGSYSAFQTKGVVVEEEQPEKEPTQIQEQNETPPAEQPQQPTEKKWSGWEKFLK